jgi:hypothetical protein
VGDRSKIERRRGEMAEHAKHASKRDRPDLPRCSFCGERAAVFEGPGAFICEACVTTFAEMIAKRQAS